MLIINGKSYESTKDYIDSFRKDFKRKYKKNLAVANKLVKEHKAIYGATLWSGCSGLPWFLSFDLDAVLNYAISHTDWKAHPDLTRVEIITFGKNPEQEIVGYLYDKHISDGYLRVYYEE